jgi:hypothetical protein
MNNITEMLSAFPDLRQALERFGNLFSELNRLLPKGI